MWVFLQFLALICAVIFGIVGTKRFNASKTLLESSNHLIWKLKGFAWTFPLQAICMLLAGFNSFSFIFALIFAMITFANLSQMREAKNLRHKIVAEEADRVETLNDPEAWFEQIEAEAERMTGEESLNGQRSMMAQN